MDVSTLLFTYFSLNLIESSKFDELYIYFNAGGRQVISTARTCNLILIVLDAAKPLTHKKIIEQELFSFGIRINQEPPDVKIVKKDNGGIGYVDT